MGHKAFQLDIVNPEGSVFSDKVNMIELPGSEGEMGVLEGHVPMLAKLTGGDVKIYDFVGKLVDTVTITGGVAEIMPHKCVILAD